MPSLFAYAIISHFSLSDSNIIVLKLHMLIYEFSSLRLLDSLILFKLFLYTKKYFNYFY